MERVPSVTEQPILCITHHGGSQFSAHRLISGLGYMFESTEGLLGKKNDKSHTLVKAEFISSGGGGGGGD